MGNLVQDVRYGVRILLKSPGFSAIAVLILALGIGSNTAIFSLFSAVMLRSLPIQDAKNVRVLEWAARKSPEFHWYQGYGDTARSNLRGGNPNGYSFSHPFLEEVEKSGVFSGVAGFGGGGPMTLSGNGSATAVSGQVVSGNFFSTLGVQPFVGRLLQPADDHADAPPALVLNYQYWRNGFGGSPSAVGKVVKINGVPFTIVGVTDPKYVSLSFGNVYDLWIPMNFAPVINHNFARRHDDISAWWVLIAARLKPGVPTAQAQAALDLVFRNNVLHAGKPLSNEADEPQIRLLPAREALVGRSGQLADPLRVMMVAVAMVLLIACANVAGLMLARVAARRREIAVRLALGARRMRLLRQLLTESVLLALLGGALGMLMAWWGAHAIVVMIARTSERPLGLTANLDLRVLAFTGAISILTGVLFGLAPAWRSLRVDLTPALKAGSAASSGAEEGRRRWFRLGNALVAVQAALAIVVLMGAGLLVHTLSNLENLDPGFDTRNILTFALTPQLIGYKAPQTDNLYRELYEKISGLPGVLGVSYSQSALLSGSWRRTSFRYVPPNGSQRVEVEADYMPVSLDFFKTMKIPWLAGRTLNGADFQQAAANSAAETAHSEAKPGTTAPPLSRVPLPIVVNDVFAKKYFPGVNVLGQRFGAEDGSDPQHPQADPGYEVVGVVQNAKYNDLRREIDPTIYVPLTGGSAVFEVRTAADPKTLIAAIRNLINQRDSELPMINIKTESENIAELLTQERIMAQLSSFFGALALVLACVGLYGLLSYEVSRRTREIGIRMALGARRLSLIRLIVWQGAALALVGTAAGVAAALGIGKLLTKLLYGVKPSDPVTLVVVTVLLLVVALAAAFTPARRATTVDPMVALRYE